MDYARNLYFREESSGRAAILDSLSHSLRLASHGLIAGTGNFLKAAANTFRKAPAANPYGESIERSIRAFYNEGAATADRRMARQFGADVIRVCEEIVYRANVPGRNTAGKGAAVAPPLKRPSVLVIGGSGFLGRYLVDALAARGLGVRVATRSADSARIVLAGLPMELVQGSLSNPRFLDEALEGIDVVYHLAKADGRKWEDYYTQDVLVTKNIAERALAAKVRRLIYTGTIDSYYSADPHAVITSDTPLDPGIGTRNLYARSKAACEALLMEMHRSAGLPVVIFRPGIVIGRGCPPAHWGIGMFTSETLVRYWGDGLNKLPLVLVRDVADALARGLDWPGIEGQSFLVTDDPLICGRDYVEAVESAMGTRVRAVPTPAWQFFAGDLVKEAAKFAIRHPNRKVPSYRDWASRSHRARYDSSKTREVLGWRPAGTREALIEQGVLAAVRDFAR
jgi:nucleoside-diphosphate-sugar epimerase